MATGTVTTTYLEKTASRSGLRRLKIAWTSTTGGAAGDTIQLDGYVTRVVFVPSASVAPTALYDVTLLDDGGVDVLSGQGANLSATVPNDVCPTMSAKDGTTTATATRSVLGDHVLAIANAGSAKQGTIYIYLK